MENFETIKLTVIAVLCSVIFFLALTLLEAIPEIPVDIDFKPFFIPLTFVALLPRGRPTVAAALGAALGEGLRDLLEGYEIDDPIGFVGYVVAFTVAGYVMRSAATSKGRLARVRLAGAALLAGAVQAAVEAASFLFFGEVGTLVALWSSAGNTLTHGLLMGALPLVLILPQLRGRVERYLGYAPQ